MKRAYLGCLIFLSSASVANATPVSLLPYGALEDSFRTADLIAGASVIAGDPRCNIEAWSTVGARSCHARIQLVRVYKGEQNNGDPITIEYHEESSADLPIRHVLDGQYALFVLCGSGDQYQYCPGGLTRSFIPKPAASTIPASTTGLQQLMSDLLNGLQSAADPVEANQNAYLLWAIGDSVRANLAQIRAAEQNAALAEKVILDAVLIRAERHSCGADLSTSAAITAPYFGLDIARLADALEHSGIRCLDQVPYLAKSPASILRVQAVTIARRSNDAQSVALLISMLDDPSPGLAYYSTTTLEKITRVHFSDKPRFEDFTKNRAVRDGYVEEWTKWAQSQGYVRH